MLSQPHRPLRVLSLFDSTGTWASFAPPGAVKGKGGVQAMPSYLRSRTPPDFARAWWAAQLSIQGDNENE